MSDRTQQLLTIGAIAEQAGLKIHQVTHFINSRRIRPVARAGRLRVFDETVVDRLRAELGSDTRPSA